MQLFFYRTDKLSQYLISPLTVTVLVSKLETYNTEDLLLPMRTLRIYASSFYVMVAGSTIPCVGIFILGGIIEDSILHSYIRQASHEVTTDSYLQVGSAEKISNQWTVVS